MSEHTRTGKTAPGGSQPTGQQGRSRRQSPSAASAHRGNKTKAPATRPTHARLRRRTGADTTGLQRLVGTGHGPLLRCTRHGAPDGRTTRRRSCCSKTTPHQNKPMSTGTTQLPWGTALDHNVPPIRQQGRHRHRDTGSNRTHAAHKTNDDTPTSSPSAAKHFSRSQHNAKPQ